MRWHAAGPGLKTAADCQFGEGTESVGEPQRMFIGTSSLRTARSTSPVGAHRRYGDPNYFFG